MRSEIGTSPWWQHGVIYEIYIRSFQDTSGNGVGDLEGIACRLAYLNDGTPDSLGVDAIWVTSFYPSPMVDFGYDISDYTNVDPLFGDLATFDRLIKQAHARNIRVIVDFVPNHTSDQHPWFIESRSSRHSPKRDWYIWADPKPDGSPPNNWLSAFGGSAWAWDEATKQYYLHSAFEQQPDLNWRNPQVREAMFDVMRFWLDRGVDGLRLDIVDCLVKDSQLRDNPPAARPTGFFLGDYDRYQHIYDRNQPEVHEIIRHFRRLSEEYDDCIVIGEVCLFDLEEWVKYYGEELDELHMPLNVRMFLTPWEAAAIRRSVDELEAALPRGAWPNYVLDNHDNPRLTTRLGAENARLAAMLLLTLRGTPILYYGDEIGMHDVSIPPDRMQDPAGRDPERTPMQWDASPYAGFSTVEPWLPVAEDYQTVNVAVQRDDPTSLLTLYRRLIWTRKESPALHSGSYQPLDGMPESCFAYMREAAGQRLLMVLNFSDEEQSIPLAEVCKPGQVVLSTYLDRDGPIGPGALRLRAREGCLIEMA